MVIRSRRARFLWVWLLRLASFDASWAWLAVAGDRWDEVRAHWPIALAMALGSYFAGSTPLGGGTVGFPILVPGFGLPASLGRDFSFAVQSIGMTSASLFTLARRQRVVWPMLKGAMLGSLIGTPLGILFVALGCALLLALAPADLARAHESDYSYLRLDVDAQQVRGELEIHARDALFLLGADPALAEVDAWRALRSLEPQLRDRLARGIEIRSASRPCPLSLVSGLRADPGGRDYALLQLEAQCAAPIQSLEIRYPLIFELDVAHRGFFAIRDARQTQVGVFTAAEPSLRVAIASSDRWQQFADYAREGVAHIAAGFDHLLFLITLLLPVVLTRASGSWQPRARPGAVMRRAIAIATAFTVAHSIALALAVFELVRLPARLVESSIALSVLAAAWNNLRPLLREHGWRLAFGFGLVHGLGFADALAQLGLPPHAKGLALLAFNLGVEAGQLAVVAAIVPLLYALRTRAWYERAVLGVGSWLIAWISAIWLLERALAIELVRWL